MPCGAALKRDFLENVDKCIAGNLCTSIKQVFSQVQHKIFLQYHVDDMDGKMKR